MVGNTTRTPTGLVPVGNLNQSTATFGIAAMPQQIASGYGSNIFLNDPVTRIQNGTIARLTPSGGSPLVGYPALGVFKGATYINQQGIPNLAISESGIPYWRANTITQSGTYANAEILGLDPNTLYSIQTNSSTGIPLSSNGSNANITMGTGNASTGISTAALDQSTIANNQATYNLKIWSYDNGAQFNYWSNNQGFNNVIVTINNHLARAGTAGPVQAS